MIRVSKDGEDEYKVVVSGPPETKHRVTLREEYYQKLTGGREPPERLIERSFEFLLRHEPNTSILSSFDLPTITRYFPDFEREISGPIG